MSLPRTSVLVLPLFCTPSPWSSRSFSCRTTLLNLSSSSSTRSALSGWLPHPDLHPPPMSIPGMWMSSLSLLSLHVTGSLHLDVHCTPSIQVFLLIIFNPCSSIALLHSSSFLSTWSVLAAQHDIVCKQCTPRGAALWCHHTLDHVKQVGAQWGSLM